MFFGLLIRPFFGRKTNARKGQQSDLRGTPRAAKAHRGAPLRLHWSSSGQGRGHLSGHWDSGNTQGH